MQSSEHASEPRCGNQSRQVLFNALTSEVGTIRNFFGLPTYRDLPSADSSKLRVNGVEEARLDSRNHTNRCGGHWHRIWIHCGRILSGPYAPTAARRKARRQMVRQNRLGACRTLVHILGAFGSAAPLARCQYGLSRLSVPAQAVDATLL
jgi:hypothetical protein